MSLLKQTLDDLTRGNPSAARLLYGSPPDLFPGRQQKNNVITRTFLSQLGERRVIHG